MLKHLKDANQYLPWVLVVGLALGVANYSLDIWPTLGQSIVQQVGISIIIGYGVFIVIGLIEALKLKGLQLYVLLAISFALLGNVGTEVEGLIRTFVFGQGEYIFLSNGGVHLFNAILTNILGFTIHYWGVQKKQTDEPTTIHDHKKTTTPISSIPIKKGETISLHSLGEVIYFEAYDNYAFLHNINGEKLLANNSLLDLEHKLGANFVRVHRKYLINSDLIHQIQAHIKGRYTITFKDKARSAITSSASYTDVIKSIISI